jgi:signal transduction histidine kinase
VTLRARLTLTYVGLLVACTAAVLGASWWMLHDQLAAIHASDDAGAVSRRLAGQYALALVGSALLALGIGWAAAGHALAPLRAIARTAARISDRRLDLRVGLSGPPDELRELAGSFDAMLDRLASTLDAQRRFVANAGHELRTPITVIRTEAEVALDSAGSEEGLREALLDGLLVLAAAARRVLAPDVGASLRPAWVRGDPALLERLIGNLVENAVRHGCAPRTLQVDAAESEAVVRVVSGGERIDPAVVARLTEPFERGARTRGHGSGLGLSIVRALAEAHGGRLALEAPRGGGLAAEVRLPLLTGK